MSNWFLWKRSKFWKKNGKKKSTNWQHCNSIAKSAISPFIVKQNRKDYSRIAQLVRVSYNRTTPNVQTLVRVFFAFTIPFFIGFYTYWLYVYRIWYWRWMKFPKRRTFVMGNPTLIGFRNRGFVQTQDINSDQAVCF